MGQKSLKYWEVMTHPTWGMRSRYNARVATGDYTIRVLGGERVLTIKGAEYRTYYSERVVRMLIERKGLHRAPLWRLVGRAERGRGRRSCPEGVTIYSFLIQCRFRY